MRELDSATRSSGGDVSTLALKKLRSISAGGPSFGATDGLVDAFAEVFARMSIAAPPPPSDVDVSSIEPTTDGNEDVSQLESSEDDDSAKAERVDESEAEATADPLLQVIAPESPISETTVDPREPSDVGSVVDEVKDDETNQAIAAVATTTIVTANEADTEFELALPVAEENRNANADGDAVATLTNPESVELDQAIAKSGSEPTDVDVQASSAASTAVASTTQGGENQSSRRDRRRERGSDNANAPIHANAAVPPENTKSESASSTGFAIPVTGGTEPQSAESVTPELQQKVEAALNVTAAIAAKTQSSVTAAAARASQSADSVGQLRGVSSTSMSVDPAAGSRAETAARLDQPKKSDSGRDAQQADLLTRIKLVQRVSKAFQHLGADGGIVRLRLAPAELGTVRIEMRMQQKKIEARVVADTEAAGAALREHLPDLRARLEAFGMQVEKIDVDVEPFHLGDDGGSNAQSQFGDASSQRQRPDRSAMGMTGNRGRVSHAESVVVPQASTWTTASGGVDVRI